MKTITLFSLFFFLITLGTLSCKKHDNHIATIPINYTQNIGDIRYWHGTRLVPTGHAGASYYINNINDTFAIIAMNDTTIVIPRDNIIAGIFVNNAYDTLHYLSSNNSKTVYNFVEQGPPGFPVYYTNYIYVTYYSLNNSVKFGGLALGGDSITLTTP